MAGQESAFYKHLALQPPSAVHTLTSPDILVAIIPSSIAYLNCCHRSLLKKDDEYVLSSFAQLQAAFPPHAPSHTSVCLLRVMGSLFPLLYENLDRSRLDVSSYSTYMMSFLAQCQAAFAQARPQIVALLNHRICPLAPQSATNPNVPLIELEIDHG